MNIGNTFENMKSLEECSSFLQGFLKNFTTLYSRTYTDYDEKEFTKNIKAYRCDKGKSPIYMVVITNYLGMNKHDIRVCLSSECPKEPHPAFPIMESYIPNPSKWIMYSFPR